MAEKMNPALDYGQGQENRKDVKFGEDWNAVDPDALYVAHNEPDEKRTKKAVASKEDDKPAAKKSESKGS